MGGKRSKKISASAVTGHTDEWVSWETRWVGGRSGWMCAFIGGFWLDDYAVSDRYFDIKNEHGGIIRRCHISLRERRTSDARNHPSTQNYLVASTPDGWEIEITVNHLLSRSAGGARLGQEAAEKAKGMVARPPRFC